MRTLDIPGSSTPPTSAASAGAAGSKIAQGEQFAVSVEKPPPTQRQLNAAVRAAAQQIDSYLKSVGREVEFHVDEDTGITVVTVRATASGDVIRQIPNDEVLEIAKRFRAGAGSLLNLTI